MNILQMISKNDRYGAQRIFLDQVSSLHAMGHNVTAVVRGSEGYVTDSVRGMGLDCHGIRMNGVSDVLFLRRLVRKNNIDVIHTTLDRADSLGLLIARITRRPIVSTMMVPRYHAGFRFMDRVVALSQKQRVMLIEKGLPLKKTLVIRPGIDVRRFSEPDRGTCGAWREKLRTGRHTMIFCHISSLLTRKGHLVSLDLVSECKKRGEDPLLVIIGDPVHGEYYESLLKRSDELGIRENVYFTGWTADVPEILSLSHFTILPSENEALGVVLMEGMAAGTPVIARDGEGGAELIDEYETGFLYAPGKGVGALADQVVTLIRDADLYRALSERCKKIALNDFSLSRFGEKLTQVYSEALKKQ
jgi:glycosyltransferase involved in cell wall biosynthesis